MSTLQVDLWPIRTKQWTQRGPETHPVQSVQKSSDMLTKSIKEVLWKTVLANGCFCFHKMKLPMPDGLSAASFNHSAWLQAHRHADTASFVVARLKRN